MPIYARILITGAAGALGTVLRQDGAALADRVVLSDRMACAHLAAHEEDRPADLADGAAVHRAVAGCDAIVHFGGQANEATWETVRDANLAGTYNVYEAARRHGVKRVVYASSNHAIGFYERNQVVDAAMPPRPDTLYGVSKAFGENMARYSFDKFGIESVCVRIGSCCPRPLDRRHLSTWISPRDLRQFVRKALLAERVGHMIAMPTSRNGASFWNDSAAAPLGFVPQDSADDYRDDILASTTKGDPNDPAIRFQGGVFCRNGPALESG